MSLSQGLALVVLAIVVAALVGWWRRAGPHARPSRRPGAGRPASTPSFVDTHPGASPADLSGGAANRAARRIGPYRVERDLGQGAMGRVLLCHDERSGRRAALKTLALSQEFHGEALEEARQRFFREAEMAGQLQHPDIVTVHEAGEDAGVAFIAMELLSGHDLDQHASPSHLLPVPEVLEIVARVAQALAYAHRQGVTHRDIKPANIMIDPLAGTVKVTDFGIARIIDSTQTRTGLVLGTPSFMSPEQMAGTRLDGRSDLYSLGVTLFQLLSGELPHRGGSMSSLIHAIAHEPAPDIRSLRPDLPQALADVVALALGKHPDRRYATGDLMAGDLRAVAAMMASAPENHPEEAAAPSPPAGGAAQPALAESQSAIRH